MTTTPGRRWPIWPWVVLAVAGIGITAVSAFAGAAATSAGDTTAASAPATVTVTQVQTRPSTVTRTVTATVSATVSAPPASTTQVDDGLFEVGTDLAPGTYRTDGPDGTNRTGCYWSRIGPSGEAVDRGVLRRPGTVTLREGERFDTAGCRPWALVT
ncbi:hypothetical protein [Actinophytocola xanthii]|uniref:Uncharacterized protein n=1 Tax=Actinophytocola xanthii TaxID=1912961 RepID=A0A1Q8CU50_9PSEU|nr:hypothetical protein [Actinophytocola xanthii]OLF17888.1 hypothetical protein BU204_08735 [Actinophytocola xanthii]